MMNSEEICNVLGWDQKIIQILTVIARNNGMSIGSISARAELERGLVYRAINMLKNSGFIRTTETNPVLVYLIDGKEIIQGLELKINDEAVQKIDAYVFLINQLEEMKVNVKLDKNEFTIIQGTDNIWSLFSKKIKIAKKSITMLVDGIEFLKMKHSSIYDVIQDSECDITIVTDEGEYDISKKETLNFVVNNTSINGRILLIDDEFVIFSGSGMKMYHDSEDTCVSTNDAGIVNHYRELLSVFNTDKNIRKLSTTVAEHMEFKNDKKQKKTKTD